MEELEKSIPQDTPEAISEREAIKAALLENNTKFLNKATTISCITLASIATVLNVALLLLQLFVGTISFFDLKFTLPDIAHWINGLPYKEIIYPEVLLTRFVIGCIALFVYAILSIIMIVRAVKNIRSLLKVIDVHNSRIDHKKLTFDIIERFSKCFIGTLILALIGRTSSQSLTPATIVFIVFYVIFFIATVGLKHAYSCYELEKNKFHLQQFIINFARDLSLFICTSLFTISCMQNQISTTLNNIYKQNYVMELEGIAKISHFVVPFISLLLLLGTFKPLNCAILLDKDANTMTKVSFYASSYKIKNKNIEQQAIINKRARNIIIFSILLLIAETVFCFFNAYNQFFISENIVERILGVIITYLPIILTAISVRLAHKPTLKIISPITPISIK
ncbi:MAG: hypothetical protein IJA15_07555 [Clostridia bacterium]|nr:hypothetical protein [Clostridia bacterium]